MTTTANFDSTQDGALLTRRREQPTAQQGPASEQILDRVYERKSQSSLPSVDANTESTTTERTRITVDGMTRVCRVETILPDGFTAIFSQPDGVDQRVRFLHTRVAASDMHLLREGAVFYWIIATERDPSGDVISTSYIRFRRTPRLSPEQAEELDKLADEAILAGGGVPTVDDDLA